MRVFTHFGCVDAACDPPFGSIQPHHLQSCWGSFEPLWWRHPPPDPAEVPTEVGSSSPGRKNGYQTWDARYVSLVNTEYHPNFGRVEPKRMAMTPGYPTTILDDCGFLCHHDFTLKWKTHISDKQSMIWFKAVEARNIFYNRKPLIWS